MKTYPKPIKNKILIARNINQYNGSIAIPDKYKGFVTSDALVLDKGDEVHPDINLGDVVLHSKMNEGSELWKDKDEPSIQIITDDKVFGILSMGMITPLGNTLLLQRFNTEMMSKGGILFPDVALSQNMYCKFISRGKHDKKYKIQTDGLKFGDKVKIKSWHESHIEVGLGGSYYIIVRDQDVEFKINESI